MKRALLLLLCALAFAPGLRAEDADAGSTPDASGSNGGITPSSGEISDGTILTLSFPTPMVAPDAIDRGGEPWPVAATPRVDGTFLWKSQTEGQLVIASVVAGATHHFSLAPGIKDLSGKPFSGDQWTADFTTPQFAFSTDSEVRKALTTEPHIPLTATYKVRLTEVPQHAWIQDRDSRAHFPIEVIQTDTSSLDAYSFEVAPRKPLPLNHTYDLVIEGLLDAASRQPLPYPNVFPLGDTHDLHIDWVGAFNPALDTPIIRIKFNDSIPPESLKPGMVTITPDVPGLDIAADSDEIDITGTFDLAQRYHITITPALLSERGYNLPVAANWSAKFPPHQPCISFPGPTLYLRSAAQLHFFFVQSHTPAVTWKLASFPLEKLPAVTARLTEFNDSATDPLTGQTIPDPKTGEDREVQTELLIDALNLPVVVTGTCPGVDTNTDATRSVTAPLPQGAALSGPYLIEAAATLPDGRIAGGRALVFFSNDILTQTRSHSQVFVHVAKMADALPLSGVTIRAVRDDNIEIARAITDSTGLATFSYATLFPPTGPQAHLFIAYTPGGLSLAMADGDTYPGTGNNAPARESNHALIITDRNLYRPGEEVKIKGILRHESPSGLISPRGTVEWQIDQGDGSKILAKGNATLSALGTFETSWPIPKEAALGPCTLSCSLNGDDYSGNTQFSIEEYRVPLFTVDVASSREIGAAAHAMVSSALFHGGPNTGAHVHWKAEWSALTETGTDSTGYNTHAQIGPAIDDRNTPSRVIEGDGRLDRNGQFKIACDAPFKNDPAVSVSSITWTADVTSIDGQTFTGGTNETFSSTPVIVAVHAEEKMDTPRGIKVRLDEFDPAMTALTQPVKVTVDLYKVTTRTTRERVAPFVFRYNNTDEYAKVDSRETTAPGSLTFSATDTGNYVVAVHTDAVHTPLVSTDVEVTGEKPAQMPVANETNFTLTPLHDSWKTGDTAVFDVQAPFAGVAWVCIETDQLLDTMLVPLTGNAARIEIPVKKTYAPNATVSVYLTRPGGPSALPVERFATANLGVESPDRELMITPRLDHAEVRPGENVHGDFTVTSEGRPVAGADLAVFAVDDAVLQLGEWTLPNALGAFYPQNPFEFSHYQSLGQYGDPTTMDGNFQKGFIIGGASDVGAGGASALRKEFRTLAYWNASLTTGADGKVSFDFKAPDNLTSYRIVAIGETGSNQFGGNSAATVKINKPLLIDPALPRFVRDGDEVELRAVVRQSFADAAPVIAACVTGSGCTLLASSTITGTADRDAPFVLRFRAKIKDPDLAPITVRFNVAAASDPTKADAVEVTIPVSAPTITRHESISGNFSGPHFDAPAVMPADWTKARGQYSLTLSTESWLPAIAGIPAILDYPHGCFEQITSKLLCYALLANLTDYLPGTAARLADYKPIFQKGIAQIQASLLPDGRLPYWPGDTEGDDFVTCQAAWALNEAAAAGFELPDGLTDKLGNAVKSIASGHGAIDNRAFALYVMATLKSGDKDFPAIAEDVYLHRQDMGFDGRALLAMGLHQASVMSDEKLQLMREIDHEIMPTAFKPETFGSPDRTEGICAMAFETIAPPNFTDAKKQEIRKRLLHVLDSGSILSAAPDDQYGFNLNFNGNTVTVSTFTFSTQENLWLILAFKSLINAQPAPPLAAAQPAPALVSKNHASSEWPGKPNTQLATPFAIDALNKTPLTFLMQADFTLPQLDVPRVDRGFRMERVVHDLTNPARKGDAANPFHIGDQLFITYRVFSENQQYFVALEDSLPAAFETVNPDLAQVGKFFELPAPDPNDQLLELSHSELRDRSTLLYFNNVPPGPGVYSILVRVTAAGTFRWPQTQVNPMYDSRFSGCSASSVCVVSAE
jgi:uncharacterized protein YfaS (alpha-2-macroglobulin family)